MQGKRLLARRAADADTGVCKRESGEGGVGRIRGWQQQRGGEEHALVIHVMSCHVM